MEKELRRFSYAELKYLCDSPVDIQYVITGNKCGETFKAGGGRMASHAVQLADFLIAGTLLTSDEIRTKQYYEWLYDWIAMYLEENPEIKEKMLNYAREFIGSYLRDSARSADKKEYG